MSETEYRCVCGALIRYRQDVNLERGVRSRTWKCRECETPLPGMVGEKIGQQHPST